MKTPKNGIETPSNGAEPVKFTLRLPPQLHGRLETARTERYAHLSLNAYILELLVQRLEETGRGR